MTGGMPGSGGVSGSPSGGNGTTGGVGGSGTGIGGFGDGGSGDGGSGLGGSGNGGSGLGGFGLGGSETGGVASEGGAGAMGGRPGSGGAAVGGDAGAPNTGGATTGPTESWPLLNEIQWADTNGEPIQAHGGGVLRVGEDYYWFGENRNPDNTFYAVSVYRSRDLLRWEFRNDVLRMTSDPDLNPANVERPKVVYNASTDQYVMWMHWENGRDYGEARAAVASSATVDGDYTYHGSFRPLADTGVVDHDKPGHMSRDCTLFVDDDGSGYFISATNENADLNLYLLTSDYLGVDHLVARLFSGGYREAPALFKRGSTYFLLTSAATGWGPNQAQYAASTALDVGWSSMMNIADGTTYHSQSAFVLEVRGTSEASFLYLGDRWAGAWGGLVNDSAYVWLPLAFPSSNQMSMSWSNTLQLDTTTGESSGSTHSFRIVNKKSGLMLDVEGASTSDGAGIVQSSASGNASQEWTFDYDGAGYFSVTNAGSGKVLDVPDASTADGIELVQWEGHGSDNQAWLLISLGGGEYRVRNKLSGNFVGVVSASDQAGAAIEQRSQTNGDEQIWTIEVAE